MHCKLIDGNGKLIGFGTFWAMVVCLKEICVDGDYAIEGIDIREDIDITLYLIDGRVYPSSGGFCEDDADGT